jgi:glycosyltransferase involved in cell wall biosynthesis
MHASPPSSTFDSILLISTSGVVGGMERNVCALSRYFSRRGWQTSTAFPSIDAADDLLSWCARQGVDGKINDAVLPVTAPHTWRGVLALRRMVREVDPDVVSVHYGGNNISLKDVLAIRLSGRRRVIATVYHPTEWDDSLQSRKKQWLTRFSCRLVDEVTTISQATAAVLREIGVTDRVQIIPCGVAEPHRVVERAWSRRAFGWGDDDFVIGCVARLEQAKGIDDLVRAVASSGDQSWRLAIAGRGPERERLQALIDEIAPERVSLLGYVEDLDSFFGGLDVFALPSRLEGFGLVFVEAALHGVPSVGTRVGGIPEAIADGETGLLVPVDDPSAVRDALVRMTDEGLRTRLGAAAAAWARARFTEDTMGRRFEALCSPGGAEANLAAMPPMPLTSSSR